MTSFMISWWPHTSPTWRQSQWCHKWCHSYWSSLKTATMLINQQKNLIEPHRTFQNFMEKLWCHLWCHCSTCFKQAPKRDVNPIFYSPFYYFHSTCSHQRVGLFSIFLFTFLGFFPALNVYKESLISTKKIESRSQFSHTTPNTPTTPPPLTLILLTRGDSCHTKHYLLLLLFIT